MLTETTLRLIAKAYNADVRHDDSENGELRTLFVYSPAGMMWRSNLKHTLTVYTFEGQDEENHDNVEDGIHKITTGLMWCDRPDCEWCDHR